LNRIPGPALVLGYLGLLPFLYGVALLHVAPGTLPTFGFVGSNPEGGLRLLARFGATILAFMGGCLWGFASAPPRMPTVAILAATAAPPLWAALAIDPNPARSCLWLAFGYALLQAIDVVFQRLGVAPAYWLGLRLPLTSGVITCLLIGALNG